MAVDVATYLTQLEKKKGKLARWETDIFQLLHARVSYQDIAEYLKLNNTRASKMEIYRFVHRHKRRHLFGPNESVKSILTQPSIPSVPHQHQAQDHTELPKFNWRQNRGLDKPKW